MSSNSGIPPPLVVDEGEYALPYSQLAEPSHEKTVLSTTVITEVPRPENTATTTTTIFDAVTTIPEFPVPATQTSLLLHGPRQEYRLTTGHPVPDVRHDHELLVRSHAIGLNPIDWKSPDFGFGIPELPYISGREASGTVVRPPSRKSRIKAGDRVIVISTDYRDLRKATYQQFVVASDYNVARIPASLAIRHGATLGVAFVAAALALGICLGVDFTAVHGGPDLLDLARRVPLETLPADIGEECLGGIAPGERARPGDWVAIWGGSSTSANLAVQLACRAGLRVASVVDMAKHGAHMSGDEALRPDLLVDSGDSERAVAILRANSGGKLRFGIDTRGRDTAEVLLRALGPYNYHHHLLQNHHGTNTSNIHSAAEDVLLQSPPSTPPQEPVLAAHLVGLSGLPRKLGQSDPGVVFHTLPIKLFHEVPAVGEVLSCWLERLLEVGAVVPPRVLGVEDGLHSVNRGLDRMRRGEISGGKLVVQL